MMSGKSQNCSNVSTVRGIISLTNFNAQFSVFYTIIFDMFPALICPSSGGKIAFTQHLVSSLSVNGCTVQLVHGRNNVICSWNVAAVVNKNVLEVAAAAAATAAVKC
jgi:hypothetical protein